MAQEPESRSGERRVVESRDPSLSPEANRILTRELREVTGSDTVEVPATRPHPDEAAHGAHGGLRVGVEANRVVIAMTFFGALVVGAVVSLATGSWWFLLLALGLHALTTTVVVFLILRMTTETEHVSPTAAALLEDEGIGDPDAVFSELVEEFSVEDAEQQRKMTPTPEDTRPVGPG